MLRVGPYIVERRLATGGMAEVLLARGAGGELVALKRVLPHLAGVHAVVRRFVDEARTLVELAHPNLLRLVDCFVDGGVLVLALDHVPGVDLRTVLARARERGVALPAGAAAAVRDAVAAALAHLHARGLAHRDVKASNVLVSWDGSVKLGDLGIAAPGAPAIDERALAALVRRLGGAAAPPSRDALVGLLDTLFPAAERPRLEAAAGDPTRVMRRLGAGAVAFVASFALAWIAVAWLRPAASR